MQTRPGPATGACPAFPRPRHVKSGHPCSAQRAVMANQNVTGQNKEYTKGAMYGVWVSTLKLTAMSKSSVTTNMNRLRRATK